MEITKVCRKCNIEKNISLYYPHKKSKGGYLAQCKKCVNDKNSKYFKAMKENPEFLELTRLKGREKYYRLGYNEKYKPSLEKKREMLLKYKKKYPEKTKGRTATKRMKPQVKGNHLHHWSYNEPHFKDVIELTVLEHNKAHRYMVYDPERKMYRRVDNNILLDTKESHIEFINSLKDKL